MKKIICLSILLFSMSFMFGATIWLPRIHLLSDGYQSWERYDNVTNYELTNGVIHFRYKGKHYRSTVFIVED